jgi:single-strand DNA-binding protein
VNTVELHGILGHDLEVRKDGDLAFARFSLGVEARWTGRDGEAVARTDWFRILAFNATARSLETFRSGDPVRVRGRLQASRHEQYGRNRAFVEVVATSIEVRLARPARP